MTKIKNLDREEGVVSSKAYAVKHSTAIFNTVH